jgi:hypothetical protein
VWEWLKSLFDLEPAEGRTKKLEGDIQSLRLELDERDRLVDTLKDMLDRQRGSSTAKVAESLQARMELLLSDAATPVTQLMTQAHLIEVESRPVQARDVIIVAKRLVHILEDQGMKLEGKVGETVSFDPDKHEPLSADLSPVKGEQVVVRFMGVSYQGQLLHKAGIEKVGAD